MRHGQKRRHLGLHYVMHYFLCHFLACTLTSKETLCGACELTPESILISLCGVSLLELASLFEFSASLAIILCRI